jgi:uncharacterized protein (DUF433 family)
MIELKLSDWVVSTDPEIMSGTPVFAGTHVPVQSLIDHLLAGDSLAEFLEGFPSVRKEQAVAFLRFAFINALPQGTYARAA